MTTDPAKHTLHLASQTAADLLASPNGDTRTVVNALAKTCTLVSAMLDEADGWVGLIIPACATMFEVTRDDILGERRHEATAMARQVAAFLLRKHTQLTLAEIGTMMGRDHTTILYAVREVERRMAKDDFLAGQIRLIEKSIGNAAKVERAA